MARGLGLGLELGLGLGLGLGFRAKVLSEFLPSSLCLYS
jgi:hypothetical protein